MKLVVIISFLLVLISCSSQTTLSKKAEDVQLVHDKRKVQGCRVVGRVTGNDDTGSEEVAMIDLRNNTADLKADTALVKETVQNGSKYRIIAMAYRCNTDD
ncbi:MAG: DUF4156 domain-containing protein [Bacteriovoracaceae bacterium]|nr:DUF4156 domain-containing protein [Bacteriovoracaceae bacterium]